LMHLHHKIVKKNHKLSKNHVNSPDELTVINYTP